MINLLQETRKKLKDNSKTVKDIIFIGSLQSGHCCTWAKYCKLANFKYDNGFGGQEVADDLVIVFKDNSVLRRAEYDGSECWEYISVPDINSLEKKKINKLRGSFSWQTLQDIHDEHKQSRSQ